MTRVKKTRKTGPLAPSKKPQSDWEQPKSKSAPPKAQHKTKGHKPGSRFNPETAKHKPTTNAEGKPIADPRHGSKKPIALLNPEDVAAAQQQPTFDTKAAMAELSALENDERLNQLLDRIDAGETLNASELKYVDERTERFAQLADLLGIEIDDEDDDFDDLEFEDEDDDV